MFQRCVETTLDSETQQSFVGQIQRWGFHNGRTPRKKTPSTGSDAMVLAGNPPMYRHQVFSWPLNHHHPLIRTLFFENYLGKLTMQSMASPQKLGFNKAFFRETNGLMRPVFFWGEAITVKKGVVLKGCYWTLTTKTHRLNHPIEIRKIISGWWFQPIWKILVKMGSFPQGSGWKFQNLQQTKPPPRT